MGSSLINEYKKSVRLPSNAPPPNRFQTRTSIGIVEGGD